ncbi:MAG TPA: CpaD family pilus assembly lipoprotein [Stellaceae bacterium]|nr:CpaD family pilus assembly lipoprotein [Stellaceae bacterium]
MTLRSALAPALLAASVLALAACDEPRLSVEQRYPVKVEPETVTLAAHFAGAADPFTGDMAPRFTTLVASYLNDGHGPIVVAARPTPNAAAELRLVALKLIAAGVPKSAIEAHETGEGEMGVVSLSYQRLMLAAPPCPGWTQPMDLNFANQTDPNVGCAMWHNTAVMAADPSVLVQPAPLASEDANVISRVGSNFTQGNPTEGRKNAIQANHDTSAAVAVSTTAQTTSQSNTAGVAPTVMPTATPTPTP